jgi:hypothetical protein
MRGSGACGLLLGLLALACGGSSPTVFVTEHLEVEPTDSKVICRGSLDNMEAQVDRILEVLDLGLSSVIHVDYGPSAPDEFCMTTTLGPLAGCTSGSLDETRIAADSDSIYHELVHGVRRVNGLQGTPFFEEGLAEVLSGFRPFPFIVYGPASEVKSSPAALATISGSEFTRDDYGVATHFMSWLWMEFGVETVVAFLNDDGYTSTDAVGETFAAHFGLSLDEAESEWRATSAYEYQWGETCDPSRDLAWSGSTLEFQTRLACDDTHTLGPSYGTILTRGNCFSLTTPGDFQVEFIAPNGSAEIRSDECNSAGGLTAEHFQTKFIEAGETLQFPFAECTWEILVKSTLDEPIDFTLRLTRL